MRSSIPNHFETVFVSRIFFPIENEPLFDDWQSKDEKLKLFSYPNFFNYEYLTSRFQNIIGSKISMVIWSSSDLNNKTNHQALYGSIDNNMIVSRRISQLLLLRRTSYRQTERMNVAQFHAVISINVFLWYCWKVFFYMIKNMMIIIDDIYCSKCCSCTAVTADNKTTCFCISTFQLILEQHWKWDDT